ncbi:MAG: hypothetical protein JXP34_01240 [Planctomycetes bacterium]|nr:hypothetical protein [Planctomycetota bacterium]
MREFLPVPRRDIDLVRSSLRRPVGFAGTAALILTLAVFATPAGRPAGAAEPAAVEDQDCPQCHGTGREACPDCGGEGKLYRPCRICNGTGQRPCLRCAGYAAKYGAGRIVCPACGGVARVWNDSAGAYAPCPTCRGAGAIVCPVCNGTAKVPCPTHSFDRICPRCHLTGFITCRRCGGTGVVEPEIAKTPDAGSAPRPDREAAVPTVASAPPPIEAPPQKPASDLFEELSATVAEIDRQVAKGVSQEAVRAAIEAFKQTTAGVPEGALSSRGKDLLRRARELDASIGATAAMWRDARVVAERALARYQDVRSLEGPAAAANDSGARAALLSGIRRCDAVADVLGERNPTANWSALQTDMAGIRSEAEQAIARAAEKKASEAAAVATAPPGSGASTPAARGSERPGRNAPPAAAAASPSPSVAARRAEREPAAAPAPVPPPAADEGERPAPAGDGGGNALTYLVIAVLLAIIAFETAAILRRAPGRRTVQAAQAPTRAHRLGTSARITKQIES